MSKWTKRFIAYGSLLVLSLAFVLVASTTGESTATAQTAATPTVQIPFFDLWVKSPHNDVTAEAFNHWNESENKTVEAACATCHSTPGYQDYLGADGSKAGSVEKAPAIGTTIQCVACHNEATQNLTSVQFLSIVTDENGKKIPVVISDLGPEARCMICHQGRATKTQVDAQIAKFKVEDLDKVVEPVKDTAGNTSRFGFINIHYFAAAATLYGSEVHGGYEYEGKAYDVKNDHVAGYDSCIGCHNPHTTEVKVEQCAECHTGKTTLASLRTIRMVSSAPDYDGDGNVKEGMAEEITGLQASLLKAIQSYAKDVVKTGIVYDPAAYPYFLQDTDNNGQADKNDQGGSVGYSTWTPRLLKAAYNYQLSVKDPGAFAHGNKYIVQLLYDSIEDINSKLPTKIDMVKMHRDDAGHFAGNTEAFRHWDAEDMTVPGSCAKCHSAAGLPQFIKEGVVTSQPASNGFQCTTCHSATDFPAVLSVNTVPFPSGASLSFGEGDPANLCIECHQGRESTVSVNKAIGKTDADTVSDNLSFRNVHYFAAGATLFGAEAQGMYQYDGKEYVGQFKHVPNADTCIECHDKHELSPNLQVCAGCHKTQDPEAIRMGSKEDYDGDGNTTEGLAGEVETLQEMLYKSIQAYAKDVAKVGIVYNPASHPYFFVDQNGDGKADSDDKGVALRYNAFTPRLLRAAYNYQYVQKDPGAYVHNGLYVIQGLYDSIEDLNSKLTSKVDMSKMVRPK